MTEESVPTGQTTPDAALQEPPQDAPVLAPPIQSRFLYVDVAAMRAKQLRRGALPRMTVATDPAAARPDLPHKPERVAMEEVRRGLVLYQMPDDKGPEQAES